MSELAAEFIERRYTGEKSRHLYGSATHIQTSIWSNSAKVTGKIYIFDFRVN